MRVNQNPLNQLPLGQTRRTVQPVAPYLPNPKWRYEMEMKTQMLRHYILVSLNVGIIVLALFLFVKRIVGTCVEIKKRGIRWK